MLKIVGEINHPALSASEVDGANCARAGGDGGNASELRIDSIKMILSAHDRLEVQSAAIVAPLEIRWIHVQRARRGLGRAAARRSEKNDRRRVFICAVQVGDRSPV